MMKGIGSKITGFASYYHKNTLTKFTGISLKHNSKNLLKTSTDSFINNEQQNSTDWVKNSFINNEQQSSTDWVKNNLMNNEPNDHLFIESMNSTSYENKRQDQILSESDLFSYNNHKNDNFDNELIFPSAWSNDHNFTNQKFSHNSNSNCFDKDNKKTRNIFGALHDSLEKHKVDDFNNDLPSSNDLLSSNDLHVENYEQNNNTSVDPRRGAPLLNNNMVADDQAEVVNVTAPIGDENNLNGNEEVDQSNRQRPLYSQNNDGDPYITPHQHQSKHSNKNTHVENDENKNEETANERTEEFITTALFSNFIIAICCGVMNTDMIFWFLFSTLITTNIIFHKMIKKSFWLFKFFRPLVCIIFFIRIILSLNFFQYSWNYFLSTHDFIEKVKKLNKKYEWVNNSAEQQYKNSILLIGTTIYYHLGQYKKKIYYHLGQYKKKIYQKVNITHNNE